MFPLCIFMGNTAARTSLTRELPPSDLLSLRNIVSILGHVAIVLVFLIATFVGTSRQSGFIELPNDNPPNGAALMEISSVYFISNFMFAVCCLTFVSFFITFFSV